jgi:hypothetical protein
MLVAFIRDDGFQFGHPLAVGLATGAPKGEVPGRKLANQKPRARPRPAHNERDG